MRPFSTVCAAALLLACGTDDKKSPADAGLNDSVDSASADAAVDSPLQIAVKCDDAASDLYGDPGTLPAERGAILKCTDDGILTREQVQTRLEALKSGDNTYEGKAALGGAHVYRVLYKTERGNDAPGYAVASVFLPQTPRADKLPLMLLARGSRGQAPKCAPSLLVGKDERLKSVEADESDNEDGRYVHDDFESMLWPLVAGGFAVIATDSAGYSNFGAEGNPASGYADIGDMGKSFLDSAHALKRFIPEGTSTDVAMVGLSQGGHTVLASLQVANEYPAPGKIVGAAVYAPLWYTQRSWGVLFDGLLTNQFKLNESAAVPVSIWYHYTHAELLDGKGEGIKLFKPEVRKVVKDFIENTCWSRSYDGLAATGFDVALDFFDPAFANAGGYGATRKKCEGADDETLCQKWLDRYEADRPLLTGDAAKVPVLVAYGTKDTTIAPPFLRCAVDRLEANALDVEYCLDPEAGHSGIVLSQSDYVNEWLSAQALGSKITGKCPQTTVPTEEPFVCAPSLLTD